MALNFYWIPVSSFNGTHTIKKHLNYCQKWRVLPQECVYSDITYAEVFGWHGILPKSEQELTDLLQGMPRLPVTDDVLKRTITLRRAHKIKLPDALILATAQVHGLTLLTLDEKLARIHQHNAA